MTRRVTRIPDPMPLCSPDIEFGWATVQSAWANDARLSEQTIARFTELGQRFILSLAAQGRTSWDDIAGDST